MNNLINIAKTRITIRRLFQHSLAELIGELLQNSQRSQANRVDFLTRNNQFIYQDNGTGIDDLESLIVLGESNYQQDVIEQQAPMGIGFNSLLGTSQK